MHSDRICNCEHCQASDRLFALANVFDDVGSYAAADCCREWAALALHQDPFGVRMSAAILKGVFIYGS